MAAVPGNAVPSEHLPSLTRPMLFAFVAFVVFVVWAVLPDAGSKTIAVTPDEYHELRTFTLFFIAAMLPSDAVVRFGRGLLFRKVDKPDTAAAATPASTTAQNLAFAAFVVVALAMLAGDSWIDETEGPQILDVARTLIVALLPSDAAIRFGRALYLRGVPSPTPQQLSRV